MTLPKTYISGFHDEESVKKMKYNKFGDTDLEVSLLSLGTAGFSTLFGEYSTKACKEALIKSLKSGINYLDSAYWYGQNLSHQILGETLKDVPRSAYYMATKIGRYEQDLDKRYDYSSEKTKWCVENNLKTLGLDYLDVIQIHDIDFAPSIDYLIENTLPTLDDFRKKGLVKYIGITGYSVAGLEELVRKSPIKIDVILSYARLTLLDDALLEHVPYFKQQGLGIVNGACLSMGLLSDDGFQSWHPANEDIKNACIEAREYCKKNGVKLAKIAMHWVYNQPGIHAHLVGMNTPELVEENVGVLFNGLDKKEQEVLTYVLENIFSKIKNQHWENVVF